MNRDILRKLERQEVFSPRDDIITDFEEIKPPLKPKKKKSRDARSKKTKAETT